MGLELTVNRLWKGVFDFLFLQYEPGKKELYLDLTINSFHFLFVLRAKFKAAGEIWMRQWKLAVGIVILQVKYFSKALD